MMISIEFGLASEHRSRMPLATPKTKVMMLWHGVMVGWLHDRGGRALTEVGWRTCSEDEPGQPTGRIAELSDLRRQGEVS
jgi:hypothetical protein